MKIKVKEIRELIKEQADVMGREEKLHKIVISLSKDLDRFTTDCINSGMSKDEYIVIVSQLRESLEGLLKLCGAKVAFLSKPKSKIKQAKEIQKSRMGQ